jgi:GNAT superfamily N-acetyltransferase
MTTTSVLVRAMHPAEREAVRDLVRAAFLPYRDAFPPALFRDYLNDLLDLDSGGRPTTLVAADNDRILGTVRLYPAGGVDAVRLPADWAWMRAAAVAPDRVRDGVATALVAECGRLAAAGGATALSLHTTTFMTATHSFCDRLGFARAPEWDLDGGVYFGLPEHDLRIIAYRKELR